MRTQICPWCEQRKHGEPSPSCAYCHGTGLVHGPEVDPAPLFAIGDRVHPHTGYSGSAGITGVVVGVPSAGVVTVKWDGNGTRLDYPVADLRRVGSPSAKYVVRGTPERYTVKSTADETYALCILCGKGEEARRNGEMIALALNALDAALGK